MGYCVARDNDIIALGAYQEDSASIGVIHGNVISSNDASTNAGAVYVYEEIDGTLTQSAYLKPANTMVSTSGSDGSDFFGKSVAISDLPIAVGAPGDDSAGNVIVQGTGSSTDNDASGAGAAYVFNRYCQGNYEEYSPLSCLSGEGIRYNICRDGEVFSYDICPDVVNTSFEWLGRILTISSLDFNGSDRRVQFVERGESVTLRLQGNVVSTGSYCPGCVIQFYTGLFGTSTSCLGSSSGNFGFDQVSTFTAPSTPGVYFINPGYTAEIGCLADYTAPIEYSLETFVVMVIE